MDPILAPDYISYQWFGGFVLSVIFGAIFGSYATLFAYRLPLGESCFGRYFGKKSRCPECDAIIKTRDLIPVINWLITLGRCRNCKTKIPRTHLFIELATTILFAGCYVHYGFTESFIIHAMIAVGLVILMATDFNHKSFPNPVLNFILTLGIVSRVIDEGSAIDTAFSLAIGCVFAAILYKIFYHKNILISHSNGSSFDYMKLILIASATLKLPSFVLYFMVVMLILVTFLLLNISIDKKRGGFGISILSPLVWLLVFQPNLFN